MAFERLKTDREPESGFTLIEVLICMGIFAIGFLAMASLQVSSMRGNASARNTTEAAMWADNRVEELLARDFDHPDLNVGSHTDISEGFTINWNVVENDVNADGVMDLKEVSLTLQTRSGGTDKNIRLFFVMPADVGV